MTPLLEIAGITHRFGGLLALDAVDMRVEAGEIRALIGPNGAGKTTLLNILCGIHQPESGHVRFGGEDLLGLKPNQVTVRGLARTFQNIRVFTTLSVGENVMVAQHCRRPLGFWHALFRTPPFRREESEIGAVAQECLDFVGLAERRHEG
ncbi:MAG: ABC transporter ATP-binding protein, partial [Nitrospinota bacterium]